MNTNASENGKYRSDSISTMTEIVLPNDTNLIGNLLGGKLLHWIDISGALAATRHANNIVATISMDMVEFKHPIKMGSIVILDSYVTWTGRTSIETLVNVSVEEPFSGERKLINSIYLVFIALDSSGKKKEVPPLIPETPEEMEEFENGSKRKVQRLSAK